MDRLIKGGTLVSGQGEQKMDILLSDGKVAALGRDLEPGEAQVLDASGCLVFPGFIDVHTHLDMECAAGVTADDFRTGTRAALAGGTTCILDYACQDKGGTLEQALDLWHSKAKGKANCDYSFHMSIIDWTEDIPRQMEDMVRQGITSFKIYLAYDNLRITPEQLEEVLVCAKKLGVVVCAHCEDGDAVNLGVEREKAHGHLGPEAHPASRPEWVEAAAVELFLFLAEKVNVPVYVVHLSTEAGLELIRTHRRKGQTVWAETCPQYLIFTDEVYSRPDFRGAEFVCSPPIRPAMNREALREAVQQDEIHVIATDHCSFTWEQKLQGRDDFSRIPNGLPGLQHRPLAVYSLSQGECPITPSQMCRMLSEDPAKIFGMYPQKGCLAVGSDADLVIWDPRVPLTVRAADQLQAIEYTPFEGITSPGSPRTVILGGEIAAEKGRVIGEPRGRFISRKPPERENQKIIY